MDSICLSGSYSVLISVEGTVPISFSGNVFIFNWVLVICNSPYRDTQLISSLTFNVD